ncbi:MAG: hypothetical protein Q7S19_00610 [bacterium]|nr:hypothetical protein [bacterium]
MKKSSELLAIAIVYLFVIKLSGALASSWQEPPSSLLPPLSAVPAPINVSVRAQKKAGSLVADGNLSINGGHSNLVGSVGIGSRNDPISELDVAGNAIADCFNFRDSVTGRPLSGECEFPFPDTKGQLVGPDGQPGPKGPNGADSVVKGPPGDDGQLGPAGIAGVDEIDSFLNSLNSGLGIIFRNLLGNKINSIGGNIPDGIVSRDFTANPCRSGGIYLNSIDPNGVTTCVGLGNNITPEQNVPLTDINVGDYYPNTPSMLIRKSSDNIVNVRVDGLAIQGTVISSACKDRGMAIGRIRGQNISNSSYQNVTIECTAPGTSSSGYCDIQGQTFFCVDANGIRTSIDIAASAVTPIPKNKWTSVAFGDGKFVAVSYNSNTNGVAISSDGVNWKGVDALKDYWTGVVFGNGLFVAVSDGGKVMTSTDGVNWVMTPIPNSSSWKSISYLNGQFIAVGSGPIGIMSSTDGKNWTNVLSGRNMISVAAGSGSCGTASCGAAKFVVVYEDPTVEQVQSSYIDSVTKKINFQAIPLVFNFGGRNNAWHSITYGNGKYLAVSYLNSKNSVMTSSDGWLNTWVGNNGLPPRDWMSVTFGNGVFAAVARNGSNRVMTSADGIIWGSVSGVEDHEWSSVTYGAGKFVAVSRDGASTAFTK